MARSHLSWLGEASYGKAGQGKAWSGIGLIRTGPLGQGKAWHQSTPTSLSRH